MTHYYVIRFSLDQQPNFKNTASNSTDLMQVVDGGGEKCKLWMGDGQVSYRIDQTCG